MTAAGDFPADHAYRYRCEVTTRDGRRCHSFFLSAPSYAEFQALRATALAEAHRRYGDDHYFFVNRLIDGTELTGRELDRQRIDRQRIDRGWPDPGARHASIAATE